MTRAPGGTKLPSNVLLLIPASYPKAKAECVKPGGDHTEINETTKTM